MAGMRFADRGHDELFWTETEAVNPNNDSVLTNSCELCLEAPNSNFDCAADA
jgi:hypothetical protein